MTTLRQRLGSLKSAFAIDWNNTGAAVSGGGIDAIDQSGKRRASRGPVRSVDDMIPDRKRKSIVTTTRNVTTNFEVAAWAIRKHLDFVASAGFKSTTGNERFDKDVEAFVKWWGRASNFDAAGRFGLDKSVRLMEACRTTIGDGGFIKLASGLVQAVEGDRVKTPDNDRDIDDRDRVFNGVEVHTSGRPLRYAVHSRIKGGGLKFEKWIRRRNIFWHGCYDRFDQIRGVSPILASLNRYQDVYEGFDYALARAKVAQLFGLVFQRDVDDTGLGAKTTEDTDADATSGGPADNHEVKLGTKPMVLDLEPGESAQFLENKTPAPEFQDFSNMMIGVALKSLDIPFSFYNESFTNFFGSKAALMQYLQSCRTKRADVGSLRTDLTLWRLRMAIEDGDLIAPASIKSVDDLRFTWTPTGVPWLDPRDVRGDIDAIKAGLKTRTEVRRERFGDDWRDTASELAGEESLIDELGLNVTMETMPVDAAEDAEQNAKDEQDEDDQDS